MESGKLRERVTICELVETRDDHGDMIPSWVDYACDIPADMRPASGKEIFIAHQREHEITATCRIRYIEGVNNKMLLKHRDQEYNIVYVKNIRFRNRDMILELSEGLRK